MAVQLPRNTGIDGDGIAQVEADHFQKVCSQWFDMRDLAQVAEHVHDGSEIEVLEGPEPPAKAGALTPAGMNLRRAPGIRRIPPRGRDA